MMSETTESLQKPQIVISENWLTRKPDPNALLIVLFSLFIVILGSFIYWENLMNLASLMPASAQSVFSEHQYWRAWSSLVVHADAKHLFGNLFLFSILGYFLAGYYGLLFFPLIAFAFGGFINLIVLWTMPALVKLIGLSGVVFWMGGAWLTLYFLIETRRTAWQKALRAIGVALVLFMPSEAFDPNISYQAHFIGFILGVIAGFFYYLYHRTLIRNADVYQIIHPDEECYPDKF